MIEDFTIWLIKLTGKAYTAFIITLAIMAGIGTGLKVMGLQKQRREHYEQEVHHERRSHEFDTRHGRKNRMGWKI